MITGIQKKMNIITCSELLEMQFPEADWLVDGLVPGNGITFISGKQKVGKSYMCLYLAYCVATGQKLFNKYPVKKGNVLIVGKEDSQKLIQKRVKEFSEDKNLPISFCTDNDFFLDDGCDLQNLDNEIAKSGTNLLILDSLRRFYRGKEESSDDISLLHHALKQLLNKYTQLTIIIVHHHRKTSEGNQFSSPSESLRGSSDISAMLDSHLFLKITKDDEIEITQVDLRQAEKQPPFIVGRRLTGRVLTFDYLGTVIKTPENKETKEDLAIRDILGVLNDSPLKQAEIIRKLPNNRKYSDTTVKNAVNSLKETRRIELATSGELKLTEDSYVHE